MQPQVFAVDQRAKTEAGELSKKTAGKDARQVGLVGTRFTEAFDVFKAKLFADVKKTL